MANSNDGKLEQLTDKKIVFRFWGTADLQCSKEPDAVKKPGRKKMVLPEQLSLQFFVDHLVMILVNTRNYLDLY